MDMGRGIKRLKSEFAEKTKGANLPMQHNPELEDALSDYNQKMTHELGMNYAVTCVQDDNPQANPRAYEHKPVIYGTSFKTMEDGKPKYETRFFLYSPVGYDGDFFHPEGAPMVTDEDEEEKINGMLFAGGWTDPAFRFFDRFPVGVALPDDYVRSTTQQKQSPYSHAQQAFLIGGRSLDLVNDYKGRLNNYEQKTSGAITCLNDIVMNDLRNEILKHIEPDEGYYANISMKGKDMSMSVRLEGKNNMMMAGQSIPLEDNIHFGMQATEYSHEYKVQPKSDTKQGRALARAIDDVPVKPSLADYDEFVGDFPFEENDVDRLLGIDGRTPMLQNIQGYDVLIYKTDDTNASDFCPDGCSRLSPSIYFWLEQDRQDAQMGISPPPAPKILLQELSDFSNSSQLGYYSENDEMPEP